MMLRFALLSALVSSVFAKGANPFVSTKLSADTTPRFLDEEDFSWMSGYTLKYENCFAGKGLASFRLCPRDDTCKSGCSGGGQYLVDFWFFIDAFTEAQLGAREYACEMVRENCEEDDEDDCYANAGYDYCIDDDDDEFDVQEYLECAEFGDDLYIGPYCSSDDATSVFLGVYTDEDCLYEADDSAFYDVYGYVLPYSATSNHSIIQDECAECREHGAEQDQNEGDQEDDDDVLEQCEELYQDASKCEDELDVDYPDTSACGYIEELMDEEEAIVKASDGRGRAPSWVIFVAIAAGILACCSLSWCMYQRMNKKQNVETTGPNSNSLL